MKRSAVSDYQQGQRRHRTPRRGGLAGVGDDSVYRDSRSPARHQARAQAQIYHHLPDELKHVDQLALDVANNWYA